MCLLGDSRWHGRPSIEQRVIPTGERAKALLPTGDRRENGEPKFNRCRAGKSRFRYESSRLLPAHHTRGDAGRVFFINPVNGCGRHAAPPLTPKRCAPLRISWARLPESGPAGRPGDSHVKIIWPPLTVGCTLSLAE
jgi:hypothetical protein